MKRLLLPFLILFATPAQAADDRRAIVRTIERLFDALAAKDERAIMALVVPEGRISAHRPGRTVAVQSWADWAAGLSNVAETLEERMYNPRIRVRGNMASVWAPYTFWRNGEVSHCGIDLFDMARVDGEWRVLNITFTVETEGCRRR